jgi:hypothetical protein
MLWFACATSEEEDPTIGQRAQGATTLQAQLKGRLDSIAEWLRDQPIDGKGQLRTDFMGVLEGLAEQESCALDSIRTFIISDDLVTGPATREDRAQGTNAFPRLIGTACAQEPARARNFFVAASFKLPFEDDVDVRNLELFSWDPEAKVNRFYTMTPAKEDLVAIHVEPKECQTCHLTPSNLNSAFMPMTPIMNELRRPWTHWKADSNFPGELVFESHHFQVPAKIANAPNFKRLAATAGAAKNLEDIIESAQTRVVLERLKTRTLGSGLSALDKLNQTMALLRPLFCEEQLNYVSEDHESGIYQMSAFVDPGISRLFRQVLGSTKVTWNWATQDTFHIPNGNGEPVDLLPVRGNVNVLYEERLAQAQTSRILTAQDVLRVRALDWGQPVLSDFRCDLFKSAEKRFKTAKNRPKLSAVKNLAAAAELVFNEIMVLKLGSKPAQTLLLGDRKSEVLAIFDATPQTIKALDKAIAEEGVGTGIERCQSDGFCLLDLPSWGEALEADLLDLTTSPNAREILADARCRRIVKVLSSFKNRPALPLSQIFPNGNQSCP